jgi:hypothetical protein
MIFACNRQGMGLECAAGRSDEEAVRRAYPFIRFSQAGSCPVFVVVHSLHVAAHRPLALRASQCARRRAGAGGTGARGRVRAADRAFAWSAAGGRDRSEQGCATALTAVPASNDAVGIRAAGADLRVPGGAGGRTCTRTVLAPILGARRLRLQGGALSRGRSCPASGPAGACAPAAGEERS